MTTSSPLSASASITPKRRSLVVSIGPRPLHLVDGNAPSTAPLIETFKLTSHSPSSPRPASATVKQARRQSSISYYRSGDSDTKGNVRPSPRSRHSLTPNFTVGSSKLGGASPLSPSPGDRLHTSEDHGVQKRQPLTLAERHSDLLHSIAQKESQCLDLRLQLATHEAELAQLKRKWERIVNLGLENSVDSQNHSAHGSGAVLEGIREGAKGVSRLIAAGLAIGDLSHASTSGSPSLPPMSRPKPRPLSIAGLPSPRPTHSMTQSNSSSVSNFTHTTKSTRLSQSSTSSLGEDVFSSPTQTSVGKEIPPEAEWSSSSDENVLIMQDTGATPTMSPNPAFMRKQMRREERELRRASMISQNSGSAGASASTSARASLDGEREGAEAMTVRRRSLKEGLGQSRSRALSPLGGGEGDMDARGRLFSLDTVARRDLSTSPLPLSGSASPLTLPSPLDLDGKDVKGKDKIKGKRASVMLNAAGFPPVSSIPGLGSLALTAGSAAAQPVSSWMGSVGRKLEEFQKGSSTFAKNQKRASILLSDVFSALTPPPPGPPLPPPSSSQYSPSSLSSTASPELQTPLSPPSYFSPLSPKAAMTASLTSSSLLDDDNDDYGGVTPSAQVLKPEVVQPGLPSSLRRQRMFVPVTTQKPPNPTMKVMRPVQKHQDKDQEDEWNW